MKHRWKKYYLVDLEQMKKTICKEKARMTLEQVAKCFKKKYIKSKKIQKEQNLILI